jgi:hypothetical protein
MTLDAAFTFRHYTHNLLPLIDNIHPIPENDLDRFWGMTDDNPNPERTDEEYEIKPGSQSVPSSPSGTPRKSSIGRWDFSRKHSLKEEDHEAPGRMQHTRESTVYSRDSTIPSEPPSPEFSRTGSQSTIATTVDSETTRRELQRAHSDMPTWWVDLDGARRYEPYVRERKESSASSISTSSTVRETIRRMNSFWDATPEEIAATLTKMEWDHFMSVTVFPFSSQLTEISQEIFRDICGLQTINEIKILPWKI